jgi:hypothetical protein
MKTEKQLQSQHLTKIKYLGINITKKVNELYNEDHNTLMK